MRKILIAGAASLAVLALSPEDANGHGGTYRGPGDTVPPGGGNGGGGAGPFSPPPSGVPGGPKSGTPGGGPFTPGGPGQGPGGIGGPALTGGAGDGADLTAWDFWWGFNKEPYLDLKQRIYTRGPLSGSGEYWLGHGQEGQARDLLFPTPKEIHEKVVPLLIEVLEKERANDLIDSALVALAKIGDRIDEDGERAFASILERFLDHPSQQVAETAAVALGILSDARSIPTLRGLLLDTPTGRQAVGKTEVPLRTRAFAAYGLGLVAFRSSDNQVRRQIAETLVDVLEAPQFAQRDIKVGAMSAFGLTLVDSDPGAGVSLDDAEARSNRRHVVSREAQLDYLLDYFDPAGAREHESTRHWYVRAHAPTAMARLLPGVDEAYRRKVGRSLTDGLGAHSREPREVQMSCALALGQVGDASDEGPDDVDREIRETLMRTVKDGDPQARRFALIALAQSAGRPGPGEAGRDGEAEVRGALLDNLARGKTQLKPWAGLALGVYSRELQDRGLRANEDALRALLGAAEGCRRPAEIGAYALGLGIARHGPGRDVVLEKLEFFKGAEEARGYCAVALGLLGDRADIQRIQELVRGSRYRPELIRQAATALGLLGDEGVVEELVAMLADAQGLSSQAAISAALGTIGDRRSIDPLVRLARDTHVTDGARGFAVAALGIVCDKEMLPWNAKLSVGLNYRANTVTLSGAGGTGILDLL